jgi:hypothetical protein
MISALRPLVLVLAVALAAHLAGCSWPQADAYACTYTGPDGGSGKYACTDPSGERAEAAPLCAPGPPGCLHVGEPCDLHFPGDCATGYACVEQALGDPRCE